MKHTFPLIDYVMSLTPGGMKEGRDNVMQLMKLLGSPQDTLNVFHITGSNGKGSVCQMLSQVLWKNLGKKVGLFTSPHFINVNERFQINGIPISDEKLEKYYEQVLELAKKYKIPLSFFEIQVAVMVLFFTAENVDYAIIEVGLGGSYDGTNIFKHPLACFITSISLEHTHVLGKTRLSILKNKLGIVKSKTTLYTPLQNNLIIRTCREIGAKYCKIKTPSKNLTNLPGKHQQKNAQMVLTALQDRGFPEREIKKGLQDIYNPGRFEWIKENVLVDTANNEENIRILAKMVKKLRGACKVTIIFGTTQVDTIYAAKLANMIPGSKKILIDNFCDRSLPCEKYCDKVKHNEIIHFSQEIKKVRKILEQKDDTTIIYGSFYLVAEIIKMSIYEPFAMK